MTVLIATPTYGDGPRPETAASIAAQTAGGWEWRQYRVNPYPAPDMRNVVAQYQAIRADFLSGQWEALLTVEHDMMLPPDALSLLLGAPAPVVYGVYLLRHGALVLNACEYAGDRALGESLSLKRGVDLSGRTTVCVSGVGSGCTLIRREIVERFPFHNLGDPAHSPDVPFALDCLHHGVPQLAHFGVQCGHWDKDRGRVLWPFGGEMEAPRNVRMLTTINALVQGRSMHLSEGQEYALPADDALQLWRAGYARFVEDKRNAVLGSADAHDGQPAKDAGTQSGKPRRAKRRGLATGAAS